MKHVPKLYTLLLFFAALTPSMGVTAGLSKTRPIEVLSDPGGVGNPTHYTIVRGTSRVTFSNPIAGQFSRAEILTRDGKGRTLTRFLLSPNSNVYLPTLRSFTAFEDHFSTQGPECAPEPKSGTDLLKSLKPKVDEAELIAKKRKELEDAKFFDESCFSSTVSIDHRNAIFNAAADIFALAAQNSRPSAKYLQCLEDNGFGDESGLMQAEMKQTIYPKKISPRIRVACTTHMDAPPAKYNENTKLITLKLTTNPRREFYATKIFHELLHIVPVRDGSQLQTMEDCCTQDERCEDLRALAKARTCGSRRTTVLESLDSRWAVASGTATVLLGVNGDSDLACKSAEPNRSIATPSPTEACLFMGQIKCDDEKKSVASAINQCLKTHLSSFFKAGTSADSALFRIFFPVTNADTECPWKAFSQSADSRIKGLVAENENKTVAELAKTFPQTSPISFDAPAETVPLRLASDERPKPTRTIASISPLPEPEEDKQLGSNMNRRDVRGGRATLLVDTLERAADRVTKNLTPEKLELLKVDSKKIFTSDFKAKSKNPQYMVASFGASAITVADIGDIPNVSFPNPFGTAGTLKNKEGTKDKQQARSSANLPKEKGSDVKGEGSARSEGPRANDAAAPTAAGGNANNTASGFVPFASNSNTEERVPAATKPDFKYMGHAEIIKFITSSYRTVEPFVADREFMEALARNQIQVVDHERNKIGALKPEIRFVYDEKLQRLKSRDRK